MHQLSASGLVISSEDTALDWGIIAFDLVARVFKAKATQTMTCMVA